MPEGNDVIMEALRKSTLNSDQGLTFCMEALRGNIITGKMGYREGTTHRIVDESGSGQARAHLPGGKGGVPTVV